MIESVLISSLQPREPSRLGYFATVTAIYVIAFGGLAGASVFSQRAHFVISKSAAVRLLALPRITDHHQAGSRRKPASGTSHSAGTQSDRGRVHSAQADRAMVIPFLPQGESQSLLPGAYSPAQFVSGGAGTELGAGGSEGDESSLRPVPTPPVKSNLDLVRVSEKTIVGKAIRQIKPEYRPLALQARVQGTVKVEVTIDENGHVVTAAVISGPPLLAHSSAAAAREWLFQPTTIGDHPVRV